MKYIGSGFHDRLKIKEIAPFSKEFIKAFLKSYSSLNGDSDHEKYIQLFDGNIKSMQKFISSKKTLQGIFIICCF